MKLRIKNTSLTLKFIGWIQIIGGITGLLLISKLLLQTDAINGALLFIFLIGLSLFIFSIYAGNSLFFSPDKKRGIILVLINEFFQLFQWGILGYSFCYSSGVAILIGIKGLSFTFNSSIIESDFSMFLHSDNQFFLAINLFPVLVIIVLFDILNEINANNKSAKDLLENDFITEE